MAVGWFTLLYFASLAVPPVPQSGPLYVKDDHFVWRRGDVWFAGIVVGLLLVVVAMAGWVIIRLLRDDSTKFRDLDTDEQQRRHEAGALLRQGRVGSTPTEPPGDVEPGPTA